MNHKTLKKTCLCFNIFKFMSILSVEEKKYMLMLRWNVPRSNMHGLKPSITEKYDDLHDAVLRSYISVTVYGVRNSRLGLPCGIGCCPQTVSKAWYFSQWRNQEEANGQLPHWNFIFSESFIFFSSEFHMHSLLVLSVKN
jgi:hypothetical protein